MTSPAGVVARLRDLGAGTLAAAAAAALLALAFVTLLGGAVSGRPGLLAAGLVLAYPLDALVYAGSGRVGSWLSRLGLGAEVRAALREALVVTGWVVATEPDGRLLALVLAGLGLLHAVLARYRSVSAQARRLRRSWFRWANLTVAGLRSGPPRIGPALPGLAGMSGARTVLLLDLPLLAGLVADAWPRVPATAGRIAVGVGVALLVGGCGLVLARLARQRRRLAAVGEGAEANAPLRSAVRLLAPRVAVYFSGPPGTTYQLEVWLETLAAVSASPAGPPLLVLREAHHLDALPAHDLPTVVLPGARDVEEFHLPTLRVVLYPAAVIQNNHMLRLATARHVFVNHGDGDKAVTYSPVHRVFDEIWVAGEAARDRYLTKSEGVRAEQLVEVGRPQLAHIRPRAERPAGERPTVLYAPTWEGNFDDSDYSSVASMGEQVVDALLALDPPVRVLVKLHPASGTRSAATRAAVARIRARVRGAGAPHAVVVDRPEALYDAFNASDLMVADVSSVVADYLASGKPYVVTNPRGRPHDVLAAALPSLSGGALLDRAAVGDQLAALVTDALGPDPLAQRRATLAAYFLGADRADPVAGFVAEVGRAVDRAQAARTAAEAVAP